MDGVSSLETITCVFTADDWVNYIYYDEEDIHGRVDGWGTAVSTSKTVTFQGRPGGVLALGVSDTQPGNSGSMSFAIYCESTDTASPFNFGLTPANARDLVVAQGTDADGQLPSDWYTNHFDDSSCESRPLLNQ